MFEVVLHEDPIAYFFPAPANRVPSRFEFQGELLPEKVEGSKEALPSYLRCSRPRPLLRSGNRQVGAEAFYEVGA